MDRARKEKKRKKNQSIGPLTQLTDPNRSPNSLGPNLLCTLTVARPKSPADPIFDMDTQAAQAQPIWVSLFTVHEPNPNWASQKSKAQLKWAPAASKDGSDYDPPSPVRNG
jgi:hypothetical protein